MTIIIPTTDYYIPPLVTMRSMRSGGRPNTLGARTSTKAKEFYCTVFGQMDKNQTNLAVVLRTYFYPKEEHVGAMVRDSCDCH